MVEGDREAAQTGLLSLRVLSSSHTRSQLFTQALHFSSFMERTINLRLHTLLFYYILSFYIKFSKYSLLMVAIQGKSVVI